MPKMLTENVMLRFSPEEKALIDAAHQREARWERLAVWLRHQIIRSLPAPPKPPRTPMSKKRRS